jgi:hypothetical protein
MLLHINTMTVKNFDVIPAKLDVSEFVLMEMTHTDGSLNFTHITET